MGCFLAPASQLAALVAGGATARPGLSFSKSWVCPRLALLLGPRYLYPEPPLDPRTPSPFTCPLPRTEPRGPFPEPNLTKAGSLLRSDTVPVGGASSHTALKFDPSGPALISVPLMYSRLPLPAQMGVSPLVPTQFPLQGTAWSSVQTNQVRLAASILPVLCKGLGDLEPSPPHAKLPTCQPHPQDCSFSICLPPTHFSVWLF